MEGEEGDDTQSSRVRSTDDYFEPSELAKLLVPLADSKKLDWLFPDYVKLRRSQGPDRERSPV